MIYWFKYIIWTYTVCKTILPVDISVIYAVCTDCSIFSVIWRTVWLFSTLSLALTSITKWQRAANMYFTDKIVHFFSAFPEPTSQVETRTLWTNNIPPKRQFFLERRGEWLRSCLPQLFSSGAQNTDRYYFRRHVELICCLFSVENGLFPHLYTSLECTGNHHIDIRTPL